MIIVRDGPYILCYPSYMSVSRTSPMHRGLSPVPLHRTIIRIGDVIIRDYDEKISFLIVLSDDNKWNGCKCVFTTDASLDIDYNCMIFSFDGISRRHGNLSILHKLRDVFDSSPLCNFFDNAISILSYKSDLWDIGVFKEIHTMSPIDCMPTPKVSEDKHADELNTPYLFEGYLNGEQKELFLSLVSQEVRIRYIYEEIRKTYPAEFRKAMMEFIRNNPKASIYDKK